MTTIAPPKNLEWTQLGPTSFKSGRFYLFRVDDGWVLTENSIIRERPTTADEGKWAAERLAIAGQCRPA